MRITAQLRRRLDRLGSSRGRNSGCEAERYRIGSIYRALRADDLQILSDLHSRNVQGHNPEQIEDGKHRHTSRFVSDARREFPLL